MRGRRQYTLEATKPLTPDLGSRVVTKMGLVGEPLFSTDHLKCDWFSPSSCYKAEHCNFHLQLPFYLLNHWHFFNINHEVAVNLPYLNSVDAEFIF